MRIPRSWVKLAVRLDRKKREGADTLVGLVFTDIGETHVLERETAVLHHPRGM